MNKQEFLAALRKGIDGLPLSDINRSLDFYSEMIDDCMENGMSEEDAVASMGQVDEIIAQILGGAGSEDTGEKKSEHEKTDKTREKQPIKAWVIVLAVLGFPIWLPLLAAAFIILLAVYIVLFTVVAVLWAVDLAFAVMGFACIPFGIVMCATGNGASAPLVWGSGFALIGLSILLYFGALGTTVGIAKASKAIVVGIKNLIVGKGEKNEKVN